MCEVGHKTCQRAVDNPSFHANFDLSSARDDFPPSLQATKPEKRFVSQSEAGLTSKAKLR